MPKSANPRKSTTTATTTASTTTATGADAGAASADLSSSTRQKTTNASTGAGGGGMAGTGGGGGGGATGQDTEIFVDPMLGSPLPMFVEREVVDAGRIVDLITKHGGQVSSGYSNVNYIIVNASTESGRNLARQYAGKKGKVVLASEWVKECVRRGELLTFKSDWAGCRLDGYEHDRPQTAANILSSVPRAGETASPAPRGKKRPRPSSSSDPVPAQQQPQQHQPQQLPQHHHQQQQQPLQHQQPPHATHSPSLTTPTYPLTVSQLSTPHLTGWNLPNPSVPSHAHAHMVPPPPPPGMQRLPNYGPPAGGMPPPPPPPQMQPALRPWETNFPPAGGYGFPYPGAEHWEENPYYQHAFQPPPPSAYQPEESYVGQTFTTPPSESADADPSGLTTSATTTTTAAAAAGAADSDRGRPLHRPTPAAPRPSTSRQSIAQAGAPRSAYRKPIARSPTPPTRIMKSTFGGNLFTSEDILYLKKYIDYCQQQGLILSLREICERLAIRAPHHTFYSWRRFCNKHQIKLGAYDMSVFKANVDGEGGGGGVSGGGSGEGAGGGGGGGIGVDGMGMDGLNGGVEGEGREGDEDEEEDEEVRNAILGHSSHTSTNPHASHPGRARLVQAPAAAGYVQPHQTDGDRDRSPTPPRTLYRSTTGKGVAFTEEDVRYLLRYLQYAQGQDMVQVWRDIAQKAPHHSRASWMKYWRRHKHEFDLDRPPTLPQAGPDEPAMKRRRYDRSDDIKLARLMASKPAGTSDQIFQQFASLPENAHHPWKGWQEHCRIHKAKIDHLVQEMESGVFKE